VPVAVTVISHSSPLRLGQLSVGENRLATFLHSGQVEKNSGDSVVSCFGFISGSGFPVR